MILNNKFILNIFLGVSIILTGCTSQDDNTKSANKRSETIGKSVEFTIKKADNQKFDQITGIGYPGNDQSLYVATNKGLKIFMDKRWLETSSENHQYLSFQAIEKGFLASGKSEKKASLKSQLGLVESRNKGKSFEKLAFYGKSTFHFISGSYSGKGLFLINEQQTNKLEQGIYYSKNNGQVWNKSKLTNFSADSLGMIAVHPAEGNIVAIATRTGIFYSEDYGNTMKAVTKPVMSTALTFIDNEILYSSVVDKKILLTKVNPKTGEQAQVIFPYLDYDNPVTYLAIDQKDKNKLAFSTYKNDVYESTDGGKSWNNILINGRIEQE